MKKFTNYLSTFVLLIFFSSTLNAQWNGTTTITTTGKVGIGLTAPNALNKLHVQTANMGNQTNAIYGEVLQPLASGDRVRGVYGRVESGAGWSFGVYGAATTTTPSNQGRAFGVFGVAANSTPGTNFGVYCQLSGDNAGTALLALDRQHPDGDTWGSSSGILDANRTWAGYFIGNVHMRHNLSIGCEDQSSPTAGTVDYHLFVDGGIRALELHVDNTSWCDYVFEDTYKLTSLEEVASHIDENGYLHNTLSAADIEANGGFELSEMTRNQQEKIEEIYLHLIDMNNQIKALQAENTALKQTIQKKK